MLPKRAVVTQPVHHREQRFVLCAIVRFSPLAAVPHKLRAPQHSQVLGDGGLRDTRTSGQCVNGLFASSCQLLKNGPSRRIGKGTEDVIGVGRLHSKTITVWLWVGQEGTEAHSTDARFVAGRLRPNQYYEAGFSCVMLLDEIRVSYDVSSYIAA